MRDWLTRFIACSVLSSPQLLAQESGDEIAKNAASANERSDSHSSDCDCGGTESSSISNASTDTVTPENVASRTVQSLYIGEPESLPVRGDWLFSSVLGSWLKSPLRFKTEVAVHFSNDPSALEKGNLIATVCLENAADDTKTVDGAQPGKSEIGSHLATKSLEFSTGFEKLVEEVIACGHRICTGNKCYEVKDEPVVGDDCSTPEKKEEEEPIMVVPAAPPAPPPMYFAENSPATRGVNNPVDDAVLGELDIKGSAKVVMNLLVDNARLSTRLELTETLMAERQAAMEQIYALSEKNARLQTQIAVNEARQHATEQLTASLIDRTEVAMKMVATHADSQSESGDTNDSAATLKSIQEDLSNIRRQIALMKRQSPVPFAPSNVGRTPSQPYVPSLQYVPRIDLADPAIANEPQGTSKY